MARVKKEENAERKHAEFKYSMEMYLMAQELINSQDIVSHVDADEILFLKELETMPKALARCYSLNAHPIQFFTNYRFCIVFYESNIDYFTKDQRSILVLHELMHIPVIGDKLVDHDVKDFYDILQLGVDWNQPGAKVPKLIQGINDEEAATQEKRANT